MTDSTVTRRIVVPVPLETAFDGFTTRFGEFKPREHSLFDAPVEQTTFEPHVGGGIVDRAADGSTCRWARILAYDPPHRVVFSWDITTSWELEPDPDHASEVEVRFTPDGPGRTRVELEHRHLDRHGPGWPAYGDAVTGERGWILYLHRYADLFAQAA